METKLFEDADIISTYTRRQGIEDGVLVDVTETAREAGIKFPVAVTRAVWGSVIEPDQYALRHGESAQGRLWDVVYMLRLKAARCPGDTMLYTILASSGGHKRKVNLKAICGPGDTPAPVITIMQPDED